MGFYIVSPPSLSWQVKIDECSAQSSQSKRANPTKYTRVHPPLFIALTQLTPLDLDKIFELVQTKEPETLQYQITTNSEKPNEIVIFEEVRLELLKVGADMAVHQ
jgi:hypothetical protein